MNTHRLLSWLPAEHRRPLLHRLVIVWAVAFLIGLAHWKGHASPHQSLAVALVHSYAISTLIWLFTDVSRFVFKGLLRAKAPSYWPPAAPATLMLLTGISLGYVLGTLVGDAYAGWSTWDLLHLDQTRLAGMVISSIAISTALTAFFYQNGKAQALARQVTESQLMLLQSQLEPHMLFNTLAHLRALIGQDAERARAMLDQLIDYLRVTQQASRQPLHPLADEFLRLEDYLSLMAIRMGPRMTFDLQLPPALARTPVPSFILQPLVENAIRHGLEPQVAGGHVEVSARAQGNQLVLAVSDNGCGMNQLALADLASPVTAAAGPVTKSWGLRHVRERLHTLYPRQAQFQVSLSPTGGTLVVLALPLVTA